MSSLQCCTRKLKIKTLCRFTELCFVVVIVEVLLGGWLVLGGSSSNFVLFCMNTPWRIEFCIYLSFPGAPLEGGVQGVQLHPWILMKSYECTYIPQVLLKDSCGNQEFAPLDLNFQRCPCFRVCYSYVLLKWVRNSPPSNLAFLQMMNQRGLPYDALMLRQTANA